MVEQVILHTTYSLKQCETITYSFFFLFSFYKQTHTHKNEEEKWVLIQMHTTTNYLLSN